MIDEAIDFTLSPKDKNYQYEPSEINRYMYNVINEVSEECPSLALHGLLDYHVYFFTKHQSRNHLSSSAISSTNS